MPTYIYQCNQDDEHPTRTEVHTMAVIGTDDEPVFPCPECGGPTHRVPQIPRAIGRNPFDVYVEFSRKKREEVYKKREQRKRAKKQAERVAHQAALKKKNKIKQIIRSK